MDPNPYQAPKEVAGPTRPVVRRTLALVVGAFGLLSAVLFTLTPYVPLEWDYILFIAASFSMLVFVLAALIAFIMQVTRTRRDDSATH